MIKTFTLSFVLVTAAFGQQIAQVARVAGTGKEGFAGDGGAAVQAMLNHPSGIAVDGAGNLYISDYQNDRIRKVSPDGTISTFAGTGNTPKNPFSFPGMPNDLGDGGPATQANLSGPQAITADAAGNVYFSDSGILRIRKIDTSGVITTIAGSGYDPISDNVPATQVIIGAVEGLAVDANGNVYYADNLREFVRKVTPNGIVKTVAGGNPTDVADGGSALQASFTGIDAIAVDSQGNLYVADQHHRIRKVTTDGRITTLVDNIGGTPNDGGPLAQGRFLAITGLAFDPAGNLYIGDGDAARIRKVSTSGIITTVAGTGIRGTSGDGGPATQAQVKPDALTVDNSGTIYFVDIYDDVARKVTGAGVLTPKISKGGIVNVAAPNAQLAPGSIFSVWGTDLATSSAAATQVPLSATLNGTSVTVNGVPAPLYYVSPNQINAQIPFETQPGNASVTVTAGGITTSASTVQISATGPGILMNGSFGVAVNEDNSINDDNHPAPVGSVVTLYMTGQGALDNPIPTGAPAPSSPLSRPVAPVSLIVTGSNGSQANADILFAGMTPGAVGLFQVNFKVPSLPPSANYQISVKVGSMYSNQAYFKIK